jgi:hypothetical protein
MMKSRRVHDLAPVIVLLAAVGAAGAALAEGYSEAQSALFNTPHLQNIAEPTALRYDFRQSGSRDDAFEDRVEVIVTEVLPDGKKNLEFHFLTGKRQRHFGPISGFVGNPLIMLSLQWDVEQLQQATGGGSNYFRGRIRAAFRDGAEVDQVPVTAGGDSWTATRVVIRPYLEDPKIQRFPDLTRKTYEFLLVPELPGGVYQIRAVVPAPDGVGVPLHEHGLTYSGPGA